MVRRWRAEARKLFTPALPVAVIAAVAVIVLMQAQGNLPEDLSPTRVDMTGAARIASMQLATVVGFALVGLMASLSIGEEAGNGSILYAAIAEPHHATLVARRVLLFVILSTVALAVAMLAIRVSSYWVACDRAACTLQSSSLSAAVGDVASAGVVLLFASSVAVAVALYVRSPAVTVPVMVALFLVPTAFLGEPFAWLTPTKWAVELMTLDPRASGHYYLGGHSRDATRGFAAAASAVLLVLAAGGALLVSVRRVAIIAQGGARE